MDGTSLFPGSQCMEASVTLSQLPILSQIPTQPATQQPLPDAEAAQASPLASAAQLAGEASDGPPQRSSPPIQDASSLSTDSDSEITSDSESLSGCESDDGVQLPGHLSTRGHFAHPQRGWTQRDLANRVSRGGCIGPYLPQLARRGQGDKQPRPRDKVTPDEQQFVVRLCRGRNPEREPSAAAGAAAEPAAQSRNSTVHGPEELPPTTVPPPAKRQRSSTVRGRKSAAVAGQADAVAAAEAMPATVETARANFMATIRCAVEEVKAASGCPGSVRARSLALTLLAGLAITGRHLPEKFRVVPGVHREEWKRGITGVARVLGLDRLLPGCSLARSFLELAMCVMFTITYDLPEGDDRRLHMPLSSPCVFLHRKQPTGDAGSSLHAYPAGEEACKDYTEAGAALVEPVDLQWVGMKIASRNKPGTRPRIQLSGSCQPMELARLVLYVHRGPPPSKEENQCMHLCDQPACINIKHLCWGDSSANGLGHTGGGKHRNYGHLLSQVEGGHRSKYNWSAITKAQ